MTLVQSLLLRILINIIMNNENMVFSYGLDGSKHLQNKIN